MAIAEENSQFLFCWIEYKLTNDREDSGANFSNLTRSLIAGIFETVELEFTLSPKFSKPTARPPRTTVKWSHERKVRSLAKETLGSTRTGRAMRFVAVRCKRGCVDMQHFSQGWVKGETVTSDPIYRDQTDAFQKWSTHVRLLREIMDTSSSSPVPYHEWHIEFSSCNFYHMAQFSLPLCRRILQTTALMLTLPGSIVQCVAKVQEFSISWLIPQLL